MKKACQNIPYFCSGWNKNNNLCFAATQLTRRNDLPRIGNKCPGRPGLKPKEEVMAWISLIIAGILEVVWAYFMKQSAGFSKPLPSSITIVAMIASFLLLAYSMRSLPLGSAYAIWTGIGTVGAFLLGILLLGESVSFTRILAAVLILAGLVLMKISSVK